MQQKLYINFLHNCARFLSHKNSAENSAAEFFFISKELAELNGCYATAEFSVFINVEFFCSAFFNAIKFLQKLSAEIFCSALFNDISAESSADFMQKVSA